MKKKFDLYEQEAYVILLFHIIIYIIIILFNISNSLDYEYIHIDRDNEIIEYECTIKDIYYIGKEPEAESWVYVPSPEDPVVYPIRNIHYNTLPYWLQQTEKIQAYVNNGFVLFCKQDLVDAMASDSLTQVSHLKGYLSHTDILELPGKCFQPGDRRTEFVSLDSKLFSRLIRHYENRGLDSTTLDKWVSVSRHITHNYRYSEIGNPLYTERYYLKVIADFYIKYKT